MASNSLLVTRDGGIVILTLNRPDKLNALNKDIFDELKSFLDILETDKTARALVITGSGEKAFCVGADLKERQGMNEKDILLRFELVRSLYRRLERLPYGVIAAINGMALGGGLELALTCDLRIASENSVLGLPELELAIIPGNGGTQRLPRVVGMARALELLFLSKKLSAREAFHIGLVHETCLPGQAMTHALEWANKLVNVAPLAVKQAKMAVRQGIEKNLDEGLQIELESYKACLYSKDRLEGLKAFAEKRKPVYKGI